MKDIIVHYFVNKQENINHEINMKLVISCIYVYIQNHEIYFKYEPKFVNNVLIFGIVGFKKDHIKLQKVLGSDLNKLGCKLNILTEKENQNG